MSFKVTMVIGKETSFKVQSHFYMKNSSDFLAVQRKILKSINENLFSAENNINSEILKELSNKYLQCYENRLKSELTLSEHNLKLINLTKNQLAKNFEIFI